VLAVVLALLSAALFGAMTVALRFGFRDGRPADAEVGALVTTAAAAVVAGIAALADREGAPLSLRDAAFFALAGLIAPGTSVVVGTAPLFAAAMAITFLGEPVEAPLVIGGLLVVAAGLILVSEPRRPEHVRLSGLALAFTATLLFTSRDNLVRWYSGETSSGSVRGAAVAIAAGAAGTLVYLLVTRKGRLRRDTRGLAWGPFAVAGLFVGLSYVCLFAAYYRAKVTVVSPLVATESLWGVALSALLLKRTELVGARLAAAALLVVAGGTLISVFR